MSLTQRSCDDIGVFERMLAQHNLIMEIPGVTFRGVEGSALVYSLHEPAHVHVFDSAEGIVVWKSSSALSKFTPVTRLKCACGAEKQFEN